MKIIKKHMIRLMNSQSIVVPRVKNGQELVRKLVLPIFIVMQENVSRILKVNTLLTGLILICMPHINQATLMRISIKRLRKDRRKL
jgi:hypothetical protein